MDNLRIFLLNTFSDRGNLNLDTVSLHSKGDKDDQVVNTAYPVPSEGNGIDGELL